MCLHMPGLWELPCASPCSLGWLWGTAVPVFANIPLKAGQQYPRLLIFFLKAGSLPTPALCAFQQHPKQVLEKLNEALLVGAVTVAVHGCLCFQCLEFFWWSSYRSNNTKRIKLL